MGNEELLKTLGLKETEVLNIYAYGSHVYGTQSKESDEDYIIVLSNASTVPEDFRGESVNVSFYNEDAFQEKVNEHEISILECLWLPDSLKNEKKQFNFNLDLGMLRTSISQKSSNSWVKAKKKMTIEKDYDLYIAKKSLFHSLRILLFGIQIAQNGKINDYQIANSYWEKIKEINSSDWNVYQKEFQPEYNRLKSQFKTVAPKINA